MSLDVQQIIDERDELAERVRQLEAILRDDHWVPLDWGLTTHEIVMLNLLTRRCVVHRQAMWHALYGHRLDGGPEIKIIDVLICNMRRKVGDLGIVIETVWGTGFTLDDESRARLRALKTAHSKNEAAA